MLIVIGGPTGVGKRRAVAALRDRFDISEIRIHTTRPPRGPDDDKLCVTSAEFEFNASSGEYHLINYEHGFKYGTPVAVSSAIDSPDIFITEMPLQALTEWGSNDKVLAILLTTRTIDELVQFNRGRRDHQRVEDATRQFHEARSVIAQSRRVWAVYRTPHTKSHEREILALTHAFVHQDSLVNRPSICDN